MKFLTSLRKLVRIGKIMRFRENELVFRQGDRGTEMFIILKGQVEILVREEGKPPAVVTNLGQGDLLGVTSMLQELPRSGTARVLKDSILIALNRTQLRHLLREDDEMAFRLMLGLSSRIRDLKGRISLGNMIDSAEVEKIGVGGEPTDTPLDALEEILDEEGAAEDPSSPGGEVIDDEAFKAFIYLKETKCPVCQNRIKVKGVRTSRLSNPSIDTDMRVKFENFEPLWYIIWTCPHCYYANYRTSFEKLEAIKGKILYNTRETRMQRYKPGLGSRRTMQQIVEEYRLAIDCAVTVSESEDKIGQLWLNLSWLYEECGDKAKMKEAWKNALDYLEKGYLNGRGISNDKLQKVAYLIAELKRKLGDYNQARNYYLKANVKGGDSRINRLAREQILMLKEMTAE